MSERVAFIDMMSHSFVVFKRRPLNTLFFIAFYSCLMLAYNLWLSSSSGQGFLLGYAQSLNALSAGKGAGSYFSYIALIYPVLFLFSVIYYAAAYRLLVRDNLKISLPVQLGLDEVRIFFASLAVAAVMLCVMIALAIVMSLVTLALTLALSPLMGDAQPPTVMMSLIILLIVIPVYAVLIYVMGRFGVSLPLSIKFRRLTLSGWSSSKGMGWSLFSAHLVMVIALVVLQFIVFMPLMMSSIELATVGANTDEAHMAQMVNIMSNPFGNFTYVLTPLMTLFTLIVLGPTSAIAARAIDPNASNRHADPQCSSNTEPNPAE
ncbi:hypothetical protein [Woodsholea maritima]|uniref:hypothetical protein n=1 Tax=Woodsholea maritima TaxID=240237 RepID=UPI0003607AEA|nr:hypothetical protein [Woodsholea maritima]